MSHFRLRTKKRERNFLLMGMAGILVVAAGCLMVHSIGTVRAKSRETVLLYTEEELEQYLLDEDSEEYNLNGKYRLEEDMDLSWLYQSIGTNIEPFTGSFDGNGHVIDGLTRPLFGVMKGAEVQNLFLSGALVENPFTYYDGEYYVDGYGALAAYAVDSVIQNCGMNGEIRTASPAEAEYLVEKGGSPEDDELKGPGVQNGPSDLNAADGTEGSREQEIGPGIETDSSPAIESSGVEEAESSSGEDISTTVSGEETKDSESSEEQQESGQKPEQTIAQSTDAAKETSGQGNGPDDEQGGVQDGGPDGEPTNASGEAGTEQESTESADTTASQPEQSDISDTESVDTNPTDAEPAQTEQVNIEPLQTESIHIEPANTETIGYYPINRQILSMKVSPVMEVNEGDLTEATPSDAQESVFIATPSDASGQEEHPEGGTDSKLFPEEPQYIGNPNGDLCILVTADRVTAGGLVAETAGDTLISNSFVLTTISSFLAPVETYTGGLAGILGTGTRTENSYAAGLVDNDDVSGGFAAVNEGTIENSYAAVTVGESGVIRGAFTAMGDGCLSGCVYDRQMACTGEEAENLLAAGAEMSTEFDAANTTDFTLMALNTTDMTGIESKIPGTWRKTENAYPQLEYFALHQQETISASSKASAIALILPRELTLSDVVKNGDIVLPSVIDGQEIIWEAEGSIRIDENNQVVSDEASIVPDIEAKQVPTVGNQLDTTPSSEQPSDADFKAEVSNKEQSESNTEQSITGNSQLKASVGAVTRNFSIAAMEAAQAASAYADWEAVGLAAINGTLPGFVEPVKDTDEYYLIENAEQLAWFAAKVNQGEDSLNARVMADIDMIGAGKGGSVESPLAWVPIAKGIASVDYSGTFDGGYHVIDYLRATGEGLGLIGSLAGGTVKGVHIGPNCLFDGEGGNFVGGITGRTHNGYGTIINCISEATLSNTRYAGGLSGAVDGGGRLLLRDSCNWGPFINKPSSSNINGGLTGWVASDAVKHGTDIISSYNIGTGVDYALAGDYGSRINSAPNNYYLGGLPGGTGVRGTALTAIQMKSWAFAYRLNEKSVNGPWTGKNGSYPLPNANGTPSTPPSWEDVGQGMANGLLTDAKPSGSGSASDPYQIKNAAQLAYFAYQVNSGTKPDACAKLMNHINLGEITYGGSMKSPVPWNPIGTEISPYTGIFDGNNNHISYMKVEHDGAAGLFGYAGGGAVIQNVGLAPSCSVKNRSNEDGAAAEAGTAAFVGTVVSDGASAGITIKNCYNRAAVQGITGTKTGAFVGTCNAAGGLQSITNSYTTGLLTASSGKPGTIAGSFAAYDSSTGAGIQYCYWDSDNSTESGTLDAVSGGGTAVYKTESRTSVQMNTDSADNPGGLVELLNTDPATGTVTGNWKRVIRMNDEYPIQTTGYNSWADIGKSVSEPSCKTPTAISTDPAGTVTNPYLIRTAEDLAWFAYQINNSASDISGICGELMADISLFGEHYTGSVYDSENPDFSKALKWIPIGGDVDGKSYTGTFVGNGHTISDMKTDGVDAQGLFGVLGDGARISDTALHNCLAAASGLYAGGITGSIKGNGVSVEECRITGSLTGTSSYFGGIAGYIGGANVTIKSCWNAGNIKASGDWVGGIVGQIYQSANTVVETCSTLSGSSVDSSGGSQTGGIVGRVSGYDTNPVVVRNCYNQGSVSGGTMTGGIMGMKDSGREKLTITGCYNAGPVTGTSAVGNITGSGTINGRCYYDKTLWGSQGGTGSHGTGLPTKALQSWAAAYLLNGESRDGAWSYEPGKYPVFGTLPRADWEQIGQALDDSLAPARNTKPNIGTGSPDSPYQIENAEQLGWFAYQVNHVDATLCARLMNDIDLTGTVYEGTADSPISWIPMGKDSARYTGIFDGNDKVISYMYVEQSEAAGLFGYVGGSGAIRNTGVTASSITGKTAGAMAGTAGGTVEISRCFNRGAAISGTSYAGGIVGQLTETPTVASCYTLEAVVSGNGTLAYAGGIVGDGSAGVIHNSYNACLVSGSITGTPAENAGSIAGMTKAGSMNQCYSDKSLADQNFVTLFDTSTDDARQTQVNGLNTYAGTQLLDEHRIWFTSMAEEATKGMPTLTAPKMMTITLDPAAVTETDGVVSGAEGTWNSGAVPLSNVLFRRISQNSAASSQPEFNLTAIDTVAAKFHTYGTDNAHQYLAVGAGATDLSGLTGSLTEPAGVIASVNPLKLYNGAAYTFPDNRSLLLELAAKTGSSDNPMITRYEVTIEIKGVTRSTLDVTLTKTVGITLTPGKIPAKAYSDSVVMVNNDAAPIQFGITTVNAKERSDSVDVKLTPIDEGFTIDNNIPITDEAQKVKLGIKVDTEVGGSLAGKEVYYTPGAAWMTCQVGHGMTFRYQYFMEYSLIHVGPEQSFGFDMIYRFVIPNADVGNEVKHPDGA